MPHNNIQLPIVIDKLVYDIIKRFEKRWSVNNNGLVTTIHNEKELCLHTVIMSIVCKNAGEEVTLPHILHINRLGIDNRLENLMFDTKDKSIEKNIIKKKRIIELPFEADLLPSYVWYLRENGSHGDRFVVEIGGKQLWKSTASKKVSLRYKLEETKKYLRHLKQTDPKFMELYSMNGDLNKHGKELFDSFCQIVNAAGYKYTSQLKLGKQSDMFLNENLDGLLQQEISLLHAFDPNKERLDFR